MKVAVIQFAPIWENAKESLKKLDLLLTKLNTDTEMVILPETFNTGFSMNASDIAESIEGTTVSWIKEKSKKYCIAGSISYEENSKYYNRTLVASKGEIIGYYDKQKLFGMANEEETYSPGNKSLELTINGLKFSFFICYDIRFPEILRNKNDYDVAVVVASWPTKRIMHWDTLLKARALENQAYLIAANRIGTDGNDIAHKGHSCIISPNGEILVSAKDKEAILYFNLDKNVVLDTRKKLPFLRDQ